MKHIFFLTMILLSCSAFQWDYENEDKVNFLSSETPLKIVWWNTGCGNVNSKYLEKGDPDSLYSNIEDLAKSENSPDVIILGEHCPGHIPNKTEGVLHKNYPHDYNLKKSNPHGDVNNGIWVFSKWKIKEVSKKALDEDVDAAANKITARTYLLLKIQRDDGDFLLAPVHFYNPWSKMSYVEVMFEAVGTNNINYKQAAKYLEFLKADVDVTNDAVVVIGDFNSAKGFGGLVDFSGFDLFENSGLTFRGVNENTFPSAYAKAKNIGGPFDLLIDHVFTGGGFSQGESIMLPLKGSDHYPIVFKF